MTTPSKRVLFIAPQPFFAWRGTPIRIGFDVQALAELGYEVDLLTLPLGADRAIPGVRLLRVANPFRVRSVPIGPSGHKAFFDLLLGVRALALAARRRYAVIHAVEEAGAFSWIVARLTGARAVFEKHSDPASHRAGRLKNAVLAAYRRAERIAIRRADAVIATGESLRDQARAASPRTPVHHIFDIPSSLAEADPARACAIRAELAPDPASRVALYAGSFAVYQGIDLLFEAMASVLAREPRARFAVIGGSAEEIARRKAWLAERGVADRTVFIGTVPPDELPHYLAAADVLLSPRIAGANTPLKLLDYLKAGRAIAATDNAANRLILDATTARLTAPEPGAFADAVAGLLADDAARARMGECGKRLIAGRYNFGEFKRRLAACYDAVLRPPPRAAGPASAPRR